MKIDELKEIAATIKNETEVGGNTAERVGKAFECVVDTIKQGVDDTMMTLDDLNTFPSEPQQAIDLVKKGGNAYYTLVDGGKTVGVVNIYADVQRQVLTEVVETRLTLQNEKFTRGHVYEAPRKYWRNYGLSRDYASGFIKKHEWTKWHGWASWRFEFFEDNYNKLAQVYDGSPNGAIISLSEILQYIKTSVSSFSRDKILYISIIDKDTQKRVLYQCVKSVFSPEVEDWKRLVTIDEAITEKQKPVIIPFDDFVAGAVVQISSVLEGKICWDTTNKVFVCEFNFKCYSNWKNAEDYGEVTENGVKPRGGVIYFQRTTGKCYTWEDGEMKQLSNGWSAEITDFAKQKIQEAVDEAKKIKKGDPGANGKDGKDGANGKDGRLALVNHGANDTTFALTPNTMHVWGEVQRLALSIAPNTEPNILAEYCFQFTSPSEKATTLAISGVKWYDNFVPTIQKGKTYQGSVLNGVIILLEA